MHETGQLLRSSREVVPAAEQQDRAVSAPPLSALEREGVLQDAARGSVGEPVALEQEPAAGIAQAREGKRVQSAVGQDHESLGPLCVDPTSHRLEDGVVQGAREGVEVRAAPRPDTLGQRLDPALEVSGRGGDRYPVDAVAAGDEGQEPIGEEKVLERDQPFRQGMPSRGDGGEAVALLEQMLPQGGGLGAIDLL